MTITEYFELYKTASGKKMLEYPIKITPDNAKSFSELYDKCIKEHIESIKINVLKWHNMFLRYVQLPDAIFWVRRYESSSKTEKKLHGGRWVTRRACKTEHIDGFSYVFVSNYDAHEIFNMIRLGVTPDEHEFLKLMKNYEYPFHYDDGGSCEESDIVAYPKIGNTRSGILTKNHWYLAHILGLNEQNDYIYPINFDVICPRGELSDWKNDGGHIVRKISKVLSLNEKELVKAHFLRFVDPLNYYVIPGKNYQDNHKYNYKNNQIGEYPALNNYMCHKYANIYEKSVVESFRKYIQAKPLSSTCEDESIDISYSYIAFGRNSKYSTDEKLKVASYFLRNNTNLSETEKKVLKIDNHGSKVREILISLGIDTSRLSSQKGLLLTHNIDDEINKAEGIFKNTLEDLRDRGL